RAWRRRRSVAQTAATAVWRRWPARCRGGRAPPPLRWICLQIRAIEFTNPTGVAPGKHGRGADKKTPVLIAVEKRGRGMGRVRFAPVADTSGDSLLPPIEDLIEPG